MTSSGERASSKSRVSWRYYQPDSTCRPAREKEEDGERLSVGGGGGGGDERLICTSSNACAVRAVCTVTLVDPKLVQPRVLVCGGLNIIPQSVTRQGRVKGEKELRCRRQIAAGFHYLSQTGLSSIRGRLQLLLLLLLDCCCRRVSSCNNNKRCNAQILCTDKEKCNIGQENRYRRCRNTRMYLDATSPRAREPLTRDVVFMSGGRAAANSMAWPAPRAVP